jgi:hypothetical protein
MSRQAAKYSLKRWQCAAAAIFMVQFCALHAEETKPNDPKQELEEKASAPLTAEDEKACRELFRQIANEDQDVREQALSRLVAKGPPVLKLAGEFARDPDGEIAQAARSLSMRIIRDYDGYLPVKPELEEALRKTITVEGLPHSVKDIEKIAADAGISVVIDQHANLQFNIDFEPEQSLPPRKIKVADALTLFTQMGGGAGLVRGGVYFITDRDTAERLSRRRQRFDWSGLQLNRDDATDLTQALLNFFPPQSTELHAGGEMLVIQGSDASVVRAARLVALLSPTATDTVWPALAQAPASSKDLEDSLSAPISLAISTDTPANALELLKSKGHPVALVRATAPDGDPVDLKQLRDYAVFKQDPTLAEFEEFSNLRLNVRELPLGLALRWIERRCRFLNENQTPRMFSYETGPGARLQFRVVSKPRPFANLAVGGADVTFLYPADAKLTWTNDKEASEKLYKALESHLLLFPSFQPRELCVIHGRMLIAAPWATAQRAVEMVRAWRETAKMPEVAEWQQKLSQKLEARIEWTGSGVTGGTIIRRIAEIYGINIMMEDSPDGRAPDFQLRSKEAAALVAPGQRSAKDLLDALAEKVKADWSVQLGAVVLTPKPEATAEKKKNDGF